MEFEPEHPPEMSFQTQSMVDLIYILDLSGLFSLFGQTPPITGGGTRLWRVRKIKNLLSIRPNHDGPMKFMGSRSRPKPAKAGKLKIPVPKHMDGV